MGSVLERVEVLHTADGLTLTARTWLRPGARASVVLVHGFAASTLDSGVVRQAEALNEAGFNILTYDSRGHGTSNGLCTLGDCESRDVASAVSAAQSWDLPIVLLGASMGGIAALRYAADAGSTLAGVVSVSSASAWRIPKTPASMLAAILTRTPPGRWLLSRQLRVQMAKRWTNPEPPVSLVKRISVPLAIVHGQSDHFIRPAEAVELYRAAAEPKRLDLVPSMGHAFDQAGLAAITASVEWAVAMNQLPATNL
jgi:alpha-beta hydrolase superfamily lysophospholipase